MLITEKDREKAAFNPREGKFQYKVMPFRLCIAPVSFQTLMNRILQPFLGKFVIVSRRHRGLLGKRKRSYSTFHKSLQDITTIYILHQTLEMHLRISSLKFCEHLNGGKKYSAYLVKNI